MVFSSFIETCLDFGILETQGIREWREKEGRKKGENPKFCIPLGFDFPAAILELSNSFWR